MLIRQVADIDTAMVATRRAHVLERIAAHIAKVQAELERAKAAPDLSNHCLYPLQNLRQQVETLTSIAHINQAQESAVEAADDAFDRIEAAAKPEEKDEVGEKKPRPYVKPRRILKAASLSPKDFLETQADIEAYLTKLRQALEASIEKGERVEIR